MKEAIIKILWRLYFVIIALSFVALLSFYSYFDLEEPNASDVLDILFMSITLAGLFGFIYRHKIFTKALWKLWLPFIVLWDIYLSVHGYIEEPIEVNTENIIWAGFAYVILFIPGYIGLYLYGFRSCELWEKSSNTALKQDRADRAAP